MKILYIDLTCLKPSVRQKATEIAKFEDIDLVLLVPDKWISVGKKILFREGNNGNYELEKGKTIFYGYAHRYLFVTSLIRIINSIKPDIIHIAQEPYSLLALEVILLRNMFSRKSKIVFRSSSNTMHLSFKFSFIYSLIQKYVFKSSDYAEVVNSEVKKILFKKGFKNPIKIIPHGRNHELFKKLNSTHLKQSLGLNSFTIGFFGRLIEAKGVLTLIDAMRLLQNDSKLLIVGNGPLKMRIVEEVKNARLKNRVILLNTIPQEKIPEYLNCLDVLVLPSITTPFWKESFGRVLIEAMACEVSVIGSSSGEIPNVIGDSGLIFEEGNSVDLKNKIKMLISSKELRNKKKKKGRQRFLDNFTWEKIAEKHYEIYKELKEM